MHTQSLCVFGKGPYSSCRCHLGGPRSPQWRMVPLPRSRYSGDHPHVLQSQDTAQSGATRNTSSATFFPSISPPVETQNMEDGLLAAPSLCINHSSCRPGQEDYSEVPRLTAVIRWGHFWGEGPEKWVQTRGKWKTREMSGLSHLHDGLTLLNSERMTRETPWSWCLSASSGKQELHYFSRNLSSFVFSEINQTDQF